MSKEEAIEILSEMRSEYNLFGDEEEATRYHVLSWAIKAMNAEPVKHGEWIGKDETDTAPFCSICGRTRLGSSLEYVKKYVPYCEYCGAKMDGGKDDE